MTLSLTKLADQCGTDKGTHQGFTKYYERYLPGPDKPVVLCEFGVHSGGSIVMWANYFKHVNSRIIGLDLTLDLTRQGVSTLPRVELYKADCTSMDAVSILTAMRPLDVIVDDASHEGPEVAKAFGLWWPHLVPGGLYVIEDTHCSYNTDHYRTAGIPGLPGTMMEFLKTLADDVNWGIHGYNRFEPKFKDVAFVHFYPGIAFIGKKEA